MPKRLCVLSISLILASLQSDAAGAPRPRGDTVSVTNHAHRVIRGEFGGVTNNTFIVSGRAYPLSVLPKSEILRVKKLAGCDVRTAKEKRRDRTREMRLERIRLREEEGEIDRETADRLRAELGPERN